MAELPSNPSDLELLKRAREDPERRRRVSNRTSLPDPLPEPDGCECNLGSQATLWTGKEMLMYAGALASGLSADGALFAYDKAANSWRLVGGDKQTALRPLVMAGDRVLLEGNGNYYLSEPGWTAPTAS